MDYASRLSCFHFSDLPVREGPQRAAARSGDRAVAHAAGKPLTTPR